MSQELPPIVQTAIDALGGASRENGLDAAGQQSVVDALGALSGEDLADSIRHLLSFAAFFASGGEGEAQVSVQLLRIVENQVERLPLPLARDDLQKEAKRALGHVGFEVPVGSAGPQSGPLALRMGQVEIKPATPEE